MQITWNWNPLIAIILLLPTWAYMHGVMQLWKRQTGTGVAQWQVAAYVLGIFSLFVALVSPVDTLGEQLLSVHMIQHLLLTLVAPPLLVIGTPPTIFLWIFPLSIRRQLGRQGMPGTPLHILWHFFTHPLMAWMFYAAALWLWHVPALYQVAVVDATVHWLEHTSFFGTAVLFWYAIFSRPRSHYFGGALMIFTSALHSSALGALMTLSNSVWYPIYIDRAPAWGISPLEDQQLAGLIMWIPGGIVYLIVTLILLGVGLQKMDQTERSMRTDL